MSNDKQSIKLYTEKQVIEAIRKAFTYNSNLAILKSLTPIELLSDEEIEKESLKIDIEYTFCDGAKWMRDKIQGGNK